MFNNMFNKCFKNPTSQNSGKQSKIYKRISILSDHIVSRTWHTLFKILLKSVYSLLRYFAHVTQTNNLYGGADEAK